MTVWADILPGRWFGYTIVYSVGQRVLSASEWRLTRRRAERRAQLKMADLQDHIDQTRRWLNAPNR